MKRIHLILSIPAAFFLIINFFVLQKALTAETQYSTTPDQNTYVPNNVVRAVAVNNGITYIGGDFTQLGPYTGSGVPISGSTGIPAANYPKVNGQVHAVVADGKGGWYIGGSFTMVGDVALKKLAHISADGTVDQSWQPNPDNYDHNTCISALAMQNGNLYAGGNFTEICGDKTRMNIVAFDSSGNIISSWKPPLNNPPATIVPAVVNGKSLLYVGGGGYITALNASNGTKDPNWNSTIAISTVSAIAVNTNTNIVYVGGLFRYGTPTATYLIALNTSNGALIDWDSRLNESVSALAIANNTLYVGGSFSGLKIGKDNTEKHQYLIAFDSERKVCYWTSPPYPNGKVETLAVDGDTLYVGGLFTSLVFNPDTTNQTEEKRNYLAAFKLGGIEPVLTPWNPSANQSVAVLATGGGIVYAGGAFTSVGEAFKCNYIAALDSSGKPTSWNPNANRPVHALAVNQSIVYAGGTFTQIGGKGRNYIAALNSSDGQAITSWDPNLSNSVYTLGIYGNIVYAGGAFTGSQKKDPQGNYIIRPYIASIDSSGTLTSWNPRADSIVRTLAVSSDGKTIYAGGDFTNIGGEIRNRIAALNKNLGTATSWDPNATGSVTGDPSDPTRIFSIAVGTNTIYAGGNFTTIGGQARNCLAEVDASYGKATSWKPNPNGEKINAITFDANKIYVGGYFTNIYGQSRNRIAAFDSSNFITAWNPGADGPILALTTAPEYLYCAGAFSKIGGISRSYLVRFPATSQSTTYSISGTVTSGAAGMSGVTLTLKQNNSPISTTTTDTIGNYSFTGLVNGRYSIIPDKSGYAFSPASLTATISNGNPPNQNFTVQDGNLQVNIGPYEVLANPSAKWKLDSETAYTRTSGTLYSNIPVGSHTVTFNDVTGWIKPDPQSITVYSGQTISITGNYQQFTISGTVTPNSGSPSGFTVTMNSTPVITATTDTSGNYYFRNLALAKGTTYTLTPSYSRYTFSPSSRLVTITGDDISVQNFTGTPDVQTGSITVNLEPGDPPFGLWRFVGETKWRNTSGQKADNLALTSYEIEFNDVDHDNWIVPGNIPVTLTSKKPDVNITGIYKERPLPGSTITVDNSNAGKTFYTGGALTIKWAYTGNPGNKVKVELVGTTTRTIANNINVSSGTTGITRQIPSGITPGSYQIKVTSTSSATTGTSKDSFSIRKPSITVNAPNGNWQVGTLKKVEWTHEGNPGNYVNIYLDYVFNGKRQKKLNSQKLSINNVTIHGDRTFEFTVPSLNMGNNTSIQNCRIMIVVTTNSSVKDYSDEYFTVTK